MSLGLAATAWSLFGDVELWSGPARGASTRGCPAVQQFHGHPDCFKGEVGIQITVDSVCCLYYKLLLWPNCSVSGYI